MRLTLQNRFIRILICIAALAVLYSSPNLGIFFYDERLELAREVVFIMISLPTSLYLVWQLTVGRGILLVIRGILIAFLAIIYTVGICSFPADLLAVAQGKSISHEAGEVLNVIPVGGAKVLIVTRTRVHTFLGPDIYCIYRRVPLIGGVLYRDTRVWTSEAYPPDEAAIAEAVRELKASR